MTVWGGLAQALMGRERHFSWVPADRGRLPCRGQETCRSGGHPGEGSRDTHRPAPGQAWIHNQDSFPMHSHDLGQCASSICSAYCRTLEPSGVMDFRTSRPSLLADGLMGHEARLGYGRGTGI